MQEKKFIYCSKKYQCGKSLGGHLRAHKTLNVSEIGEQIQANVIKFESGGESDYGLRENPKKSWRLEGLDSGFQQEKMCRECGKRFPSSKALCGHMACHSEKEKAILVMDSQSDTEKSGQKQLRRSTRVRNRSLKVYDCSSVSGIEQEEEEVAISLLMLSNDNCGRKGFDLNECSDTNSMILEAKSSSSVMKVTVKIGGNSVSKVDVLENSDSGYFGIGMKKVKSDVSPDGFRGIKLKKPKVNRMKTDVGKASEEGKRSDSANIASKSGVSKLSRKKKGCKYRALNSDLAHAIWDSTISGCSESVCESEETSTETNSNSIPMHMLWRAKNQIPHCVNNSAKKRLGQKKIKAHVCSFCFKAYRSAQALGGHKKSHYQPVIINQERWKSPCMIDLNLPAPMEVEDEAEANVIPELIE